MGVEYWIINVPNGSHRHIVTAMKLKAEGVKRGVPDILLLHAAKGSHGLAIELKKEKGGVVSAEQKTWIANLKSEGYAAHVCKGAGEAIQVLIDYLS